MPWSVLPASGCNEKDKKSSDRPVSDGPAYIADPSHPTLAEQVAKAAIERTHHKVRYDPKYVKIPYPGGDVPADTGVCTDVVVRSYRAVGIDLQQLVHEDMKADFNSYPQLWGLTGPDSNIDHRRVPNLMTFFDRHGASLAVTRNGRDYLPGDVVAWNLSSRVRHIGIVVKLADDDRALVVHNIGAGPKLEDCLFNWEIIGHYRYPVAN